MPATRRLRRPFVPPTRRELEVSLLLADGLSDKEIAKRLAISVRTAEHHVSAVLSKLGLTRMEMIVAVGRIGRRADLGTNRVHAG
jgi:DNA-binding NarL/FixJ family response regulator